MSIYQRVNQINDFIKINRVLVSCTDKAGLISNKDIKSANFPTEGIIGELTKINPDILFISTGHTYQMLSEAGYNTLELAEYTGYPEMKSGLVKSLHPKIYAGILGHPYTEDDIIYLQDHHIQPIDAVIVNFYDLKKTIIENNDCEDKRQAIDIGGPTLCHAARKSYINTVLLTSKDDYMSFVQHLKTHHGCVSLNYRLELAKKASHLLTELMGDIDSVIQSISLDDIQNVYKLM